MNLTEVTTLMVWIEDHKIDNYVQISPLKDAILDLLEKTIVESPILIGETN